MVFYATIVVVITTYHMHIYVNSTEWYFVNMFFPITHIDLTMVSESTYIFNLLFFIMLHVSCLLHMKNNILI